MRSARPIRRIGTPVTMAPGSLADLNYGQSARPPQCPPSLSLSSPLSSRAWLGHLVIGEEESPPIFDRFALPAHDPPGVTGSCWRPPCPGRRVRLACARPLHKRQGEAD